MAGAGAAPGDLDPSFGSGGKVLTDLGGDERAYAIAVQPDGKIVAAGFSDTFPQSDFALARHKADGSLDPSFGAGGRVLTDLGDRDEARAIVLQADGRIVAAGYTDAEERSEDFALVRYRAGGSLDASFGSGGVVLTDFFRGSPDLAFAAALQPNGRIVAAGHSTGDFALARYSADGSLDPSFGSGGKVLTNFGGQDGAFAIALQPDRKIVAAGTSDVHPNGGWALARYNADGSLDSSFGDGGLVLTTFDGSVDQARAVAVQPDGRILAAGFTWRPKFTLARYNADGSLDASFGDGGKVQISFGECCGRAFAIAVQADGRLVAAGSASSAFALARFEPDGSLDASFGSAAGY